MSEVMCYNDHKETEDNLFCVFAVYYIALGAQWMTVVVRLQWVQLEALCFTQ